MTQYLSQISFMASKNLHIYFLTIIILLSFNLVNAQDEETNSQRNPSDSKIEAIFDLMGILLILLSIDAVHASNSRTAKLTYFSLRMLSYFFQSLILALSIFFTYRIYNDTRNFFYIQYLITSLAFTTANLLLDLINRREPDILSSSEFVVHITFFIIAVIRGYINNSRYLFILIPSLFGIFFPIFAYVVVILQEEIAARSRTQSLISVDQKEETITCAGKLVSVILAFIFGELMNHGILEDEYNFAVMSAIKEKLKLASICSQFIFCLIVSPDALWIKAYLTSLVIYASVDVKIRELREEKRKNKHKIHELPVDNEKHTVAVTAIV
ncbi:16197_t:CDS:2 [Dentiscutata heterogama]|uniref:16197_t:CDS:1 n=1 Tax=Dentiscutata heterogama TaxID=1316150 RepID=A0ACA9M9D2_9GLOM|nr:16197_t:CDS:2 [Dentiscutata heterogama]